MVVASNVFEESPEDMIWVVTEDLFPDLEAFGVDVSFLGLVAKRIINMPFFMVLGSLPTITCWFRGGYLCSRLTRMPLKRLRFRCVSPSSPWSFTILISFRGWGAELGSILKVDELTSIHSRGRIEYEGLHLICFKCGKYGHKLDQCPEPEEPLIIHQHVPAPHTYPSQPAGSMPPHTSSPKANEEEYFGPWVLARKPQRRQFLSNKMSQHIEGDSKYPPPRDLVLKSFQTGEENLQPNSKDSPAKVDSPPKMKFPTPVPPPNPPPRNRLGKKDSPKVHGLVSIKKGASIPKQSKVNSKIHRDQECLAELKEISEEDIIRRKNEQDMLELMRRHKERIRDQCRHEGSIIDLLGGTSFWGATHSSPSIHAHPLAPDAEELKN
ncbi:Zinc finger, CCHC-type [Sesbania bispinosa]|nr:Zinc finger, CCHC-type [Sesbania bispinosa]